MRSQPRSGRRMRGWSIGTGAATACASSRCVRADGAGAADRQPRCHRSVVRGPADTAGRREPAPVHPCAPGWRACILLSGGPDAETSGPPGRAGRRPLGARAGPSRSAARRSRVRPLRRRGDGRAHTRSRHPCGGQERTHILDIVSVVRSSYPPAGWSCPDLGMKNAHARPRRRGRTARPTMPAWPRRKREPKSCGALRSPARRRTAPRAGMMPGAADPRHGRRCTTCSAACARATWKACC